MFMKIIQTLTQKQKVALGSLSLLGVCGIPVFITRPKEKAGHDLFSQEKPETVLKSQQELLKEFDRKSKEERRK